jgi:hypothetical protein
MADSYLSRKRAASRQCAKPRGALRQKSPPNFGMRGHAETTCITVIDLWRRVQRGYWLLRRNRTQRVPARRQGAPSPHDPVRLPVAFAIPRPPLPATASWSKVYNRPSEGARQTRYIAEVPEPDRWYGGKGRYPLVRTQVLADRRILCTFGKPLIGLRQFANNLLCFTSFDVCCYATHFPRPSTKPLWLIEDSGTV